MSAVGIATHHVAAAIEEAKASNVGPDVVGRHMIDAVIALFLRTRPVEDVKRELQFITDTVDPDTDFIFMRP